MSYLFDVGEPTNIPARTCTPARPGTGPEGETCKTCLHYRSVKYHNEAYPKCGRMEHTWTHGAGSDIKAGWPACRAWQSRKEAKP